MLLCCRKMCVRTAAVLILLLLHLSLALRTNDKRNQSSEVRLRRHDSEERTASGRRWTTSRNSPYQKIVSSFEQVVSDLRDAGSERMETSTPDDSDQAKAKIHKRKQWRTSASSHDQIPSGASSDSESQKARTEGNAPELTDPQVILVQRNQKSAGSSSRRRTTASHTREPTPEPNIELTTVSQKKRRRPTTTPVTTTTPAPQTMSDSLYKHFRPLDQDVPQDDIIPFLDFGRKLSPVVPTPSGVNSIESKSTLTKLRSRNHHEEKESNSSDEEVLQEDMDVTVVKKAIERNSVPRGKLRVREQGISDYYRKRVPSQVRTTENLISTSDASTASPVLGSKTIGVLKKINRHQTHNIPPQKNQQILHKLPPDVEHFHTLKDVEILHEHRRPLSLRPVQMSAALKEEIPHSPLTAESTLVKTVIKEIPEVSSTEREFKSPNSTQSAMTNNTLQDWTLNKNSSLLFRNNYSNSSQSKLIESDRKEINNTKILSTAVVTSVSVKDSAEDAKEALEVVPTEEITTSSTASPVSSSTVSILPPFDIVSNTNIPSDDSPPRSLIYNKSLTSSTPKTFTDDVNASTGYVRTTTVRNNTPLRSRDIYNKPRTIPAGISLPHLPRQIPFLLNKNMSLRTSSPVETTSSVNNLEKSSRTDSPLIHSTPSPPSTLPEEQTPGIVTTFTPSTTIQTTVTITPPESISRHSSVPTVIPQSQQNSVANTTAYVPLEYLANNSSTYPTSVKTLASSIDTTISSTTTSSTTDKLEQSTKASLQDSIRGNEHNTSLSAPSADEEEAPQHVEGQSVPPPKYEEPAETTTSTSAYSPEDDADKFPIYFTTLPTATVPVVDTRPETEEAVVEEQRNTTSPRPGADWVKVGAVDKEVEVVYPEPLGLGAYLLAALGVVPVVLGALIGARFILAHNKKKVLDESEYSSEYNRSPLGISTSSPLPTKLPRIPTHVSWGETEKSAPTITPVTSAAARWEFPRDKLRLQTLLGQGNFGQVWKAEADDISGHEGLTRLVAVKTVKESATSREREDLLRELGIMQELGSHPNVVTLLGCCTEKEPIYLLMEYVMYGKLLSFLRDHRTRAHYYNFSDAGDALTSRDLTVFGYCVARGMDYLTNKSIIHRDMAARNVLVDHNKLCKIADFGMSRNVRDTGQIYEQRQSKGALPIRWMAPESLHFSLFTHKTDVWSFGILMWEIVTLGSTPYATMGAREVMRRVGDGYRLERPSHCRSELFRVIAKCWHSEPSKRPTFAELKVELGQLLSDSELNGSYVDLDSFADEMRRDTLHRHH